MKLLINYSVTGRLILRMLMLTVTAIVVDSTCAVAEEPVVFADPKLKAAVEEELGISDPTPTNMLSLTSFNAGSKRISNLTGLEYAQNLSHLSLSNNSISDISSLSELKQLRYLDLHSNYIIDILPLIRLTNLTELYLGWNDIIDISSLTELKQLEYLDLRYNKLTHILPLAQLNNLTELYLTSNEIINIPPLTDLKNLVHLDLEYNQLTNISALAQSTNLRELYLGYNQITDISSLAGLKYLTELDLSDNQISNISVLAQLTNLKFLYLRVNEITDIFPLRELENLVVLRLSVNEIADIRALSQLKNLSQLWLSGNNITNISPLAQLTNLRILYLWSNQITDISALADLTNLAELDLWRNQIKDISPLAGLKNLTNLDLSNNEISDISALVKLTNLIELKLEGYPLNDEAYYKYIEIIISNNPNVDTDIEPRGIQKVVYFVDANAKGTNDGSTWQNAYICLQDALATAGFGDEIRVAAGTYKPDRQSVSIIPFGFHVQASGDREATFQLKNSLTLKGGYAGLSGADPNIRNVELFETILSGDLGDNDVGDLQDSSRTENSFHVVSGHSVDHTAVLDGFIITAGHAWFPGPFFPDFTHGGGMIVGGVFYDNGNPTIRNCIFWRNYAHWVGGGLSCGSSGQGTTIEGCRFIDNQAGSFGGGIDLAGPMTLRNCFFSENSAGESGGGIDAYSDDMKFINCVFQSNTAQYAGAIKYEKRGVSGMFMNKTPDLLCDNLIIRENFAAPGEPNAGLFQPDKFGFSEGIELNLVGDLNLETGRLDVSSAVFDGIGTINLGSGALLKVTGVLGDRVTTVRTNIIGPGDLEIDVDQQLIIEGDAVVNLSGLKDQTPDPNAGYIIVRGSLVVRGNATLESTNVDVKLFDVNTPNDIQYNNITLQEASTGFGGEFFVAGNAKIKHNNIVSEGDRYLDMDPDPFAPERPTITQNRVTVIIKEGILGSQGTLLELRAKDYDFHSFGTSGAHWIHDSAGFTEDPSVNWLLEKLELKPGAKLNLTNRQGFVFQDFNEPYPETVYVKELVMGPDSVLNTALQTLYYQNLVLTDSNGLELIRNPAHEDIPLINGAQIVDIPLLGFSLGIIAMNDQMEFDVRVRKRLLDPNDEQPAPPEPPDKIGSIERIDYDPDVPIPLGSGGVMDMRTQDPNKESASSIAAKGAFARAGDEAITIECEYMFIEPYNDAEIIVYLSDKPEVDENIVEVARIYPPQQPGLPGSSASGRFAVFSGIFSRGNLNFTRGTYVQLELRGKNTRCWIDNWDPKIYCNTCCNFDGVAPVDTKDLYLLLAELGRSDPSHGDRGCLDLATDGYVSIDDVVTWDTISTGKHACPPGYGYELGLEFAESVEVESSMMTLSLKENNPGSLGSLRLYGLPDDWNPKGDDNRYRCLYNVSLSSEGVNAVNDDKHKRDGPYGRLITDGQGNLYQIAGDGGIVDNSGWVVVEPKKQITYAEDGRSTVTIGFHEGEGTMLLDAAFHPVDPNIVYVVPVLVNPNDGNSQYMAAAKLELKDGGDWELRKLYGKNPVLESSHKSSDIINWRSFVYQPDVYHLHEIEIAPDGEDLFVLSRCSLNKYNYVLIYDEERGNDSEVVQKLLSDPNNNEPYVDGPTAMLVSSSGDRLYLASSVDNPNEPNDLVTEVYRYTIVRDGQRVDLTLTYEDIIYIDCPFPRICDTNPSLYDENLGFTSMITSMAENPADETLYVTGFTSPKFPAGVNWWDVKQPYIDIDSIFTTPMMAVVSADESSANACPITGSNLALPISLVWIPAEPNGADFSAEVTPDMKKLCILASYWLDQDYDPSN